MSISCPIMVHKMGRPAHGPFKVRARRVRAIFIEDKGYFQRTGRKLRKYLMLWQRYEYTEYAMRNKA